MSEGGKSSIERDREEVEMENRKLLEKDLRNTRNFNSSNLNSEDVTISKLSSSEKRNLVPELREVSRQVYLEKRAKQQLELLEGEIHDNEIVVVALIVNSIVGAENPYIINPLISATIEESRISIVDIKNVVPIFADSILCLL